MTSKLSPLRSIRAKCIDCAAGSSQEVRLCTAINCPIYLYRFGHYPHLKSSEVRSTKTNAEEPLVSDKNNDSSGNMVRK